MSLWSSLTFCGVCRFLRSIECEKQNPINNFAVLKRCRNKCYEMLTIKESNAERFCNNWPLMWLTRLLALLNTKHIGPAFNIFSLLFCKIRRSFQYFLLCLEKDERKKKTSEYNKSQYLLIWVISHNWCQYLASSCTKIFHGNRWIKIDVCSIISEKKRSICLIVCIFTWAGEKCI